METQLGKKFGGFSFLEKAIALWTVLTWMKAAFDDFAQSEQQVSDFGFTLWNINYHPDNVIYTSLCLQQP